KALVEDPPGTKKLLAVAAKMAREKNQPFNYNGALILATSALQLRELEASRVLYRVCFEQAAKVRSYSKIEVAFKGMEGVILLLYADKRFEQSAKASQEFLEVIQRLEKDERISKVLKTEILRLMIRAMAKQGKTAEAAKMVDDLVKVRPNEWRNYGLRA